MKTLVGWIRRHQLVAFYAITFVITWGLGFSYDAVMRHDQFWLIPLASIATCGPALAGIIVSAVCNTEPKKGSSRARWIAFSAALVVVTAVFVAHNTVVNRAPLNPVLVGLVLVGIAPPVAYVISAAYSRAPAVRRYLASLVHPRAVLGWALLAIVLLPGLNLLSIAISRWLGRQPASPTGNPAAGLSLVGVIAITFLYQFFLYNATGEEAGWSGFARPRLQAHVSPLLASLVMTVFWALWHAFYWYGQEPVFSPRYWIDTYVRLVPAVVLIGWFYNRSKGSIFLAGVVHAVANTAFAYMPNIDWPVHTVTMYVAAAALVFLDRMWAKLPADHPAVVSGSSALDEMRKHSGEGEEVELADATEPGTARI
ncbi:MAG: CPBP family intramembrane glutamic endopeptidase [Anaerolineae bacterium]